MNIVTGILRNTLSRAVKRCDYHRLGWLMAIAIITHGFIDGTAYARTPREIERELVDQLDILSMSFQNDGYVEMSYQLDRSGLRQGESRTWELILDAAATYIITAVCDNDCDDIDLELWRTDAIVGRDQLDNSYPRVEQQLEADTYRVTVTMQQCQIEPCYSALKVFRLR